MAYSGITKPLVFKVFWSHIDLDFICFQDHVYFFFREGAVEHINCGKAVFSRVARVCKNDAGGPNKAK